MSLFCFAVMCVAGGEPDLIMENMKSATGIFGCDGYSLYSDTSMSMHVPEAGGLSVSTTRLNVSLSARMGGASDLTSTWLNTEAFIQAWNRLIADGDYRRYEWVVKVDPDAVFLPGRLRAQLVKLTLPTLNGVRPCLTQTTCPEVWWQQGGGYHCRDDRGGCKPASQGPFSAAECRRQCYLGTPPQKAKKLSSAAAAASNLTAPAHKRNGVPPCVGATPCPGEWARPGGPGGYLCARTEGCRPGDTGPFAAQDCPDQCYYGKPRIQIATRYRPGARVYVQNCRLGFGFYGAAEVVSRAAVEAYAKGKGRCFRELSFDGWGEDLFMQSCLQLLGVHRLEGPEVLSDRYCGAEVGGCDSGASIFHPFKSAPDFARCLNQAMASDEPMLPRVGAM